jgi:hypothetical protein
LTENRFALKAALTIGGASLICSRYSWLSTSRSQAAVYTAGLVSEVTVMRPNIGGSTPKGQIIVLGFDWFEGAPVGGIDGGWNDVLHRAIQFASKPF